jgi:tight adherence protein C
VSDVGLLTVVTAVGVGGLLLAVSGWLQPAPPLSRVIAHLQRQPTTPAGDRRDASTDRWVGPVADALRNHPSLLPSESDLAVVGRPLEQHVLWLLLSAFAGFATPPLLLSLVQSTGAIGVGWYVPLALALVGAVLGPFIVHTATVDGAAQIKSDLRYQVSAYLDVVTMLLAGNTGYEGALEQAAHAGDGRLFVELRRRIRDAGARGASLTEALRRTGVDLGLEELEQIAATAALSAAEGAPVARTLAAKCATLRSALATEQESEARLRTSRLTTPIVGMSLIFMALVIYPALSLT